MLKEFDDITSKLGEPAWFDDDGVPKYCAFKPERVNVYAGYVAFLDIACQDCKRRFKVGSRPSGPPMVLPTAEDIGTFDFGDPPAHNCAGDSMTSTTLAVLEFWERDMDRWENGILKAGATLDWRRRPEFEFVYSPAGE